MDTDLSRWAQVVVDAPHVGEIVGCAALPHAD